MKKIILKIEHLKKSFGEKNVIKDFDLDDEDESDER